MLLPARQHRGPERWLGLQCDHQSEVCVCVELKSEEHGDEVLLSIVIISACLGMHGPTMRGSRVKLHPPLVELACRRANIWCPRMLRYDLANWCCILALALLVPLQLLS